MPPACRTSRRRSDVGAGAQPGSLRSSGLEVRWWPGWGMAGGEASPARSSAPAVALACYNKRFLLVVLLCFWGLVLLFCGCLFRFGVVFFGVVCFFSLKHLVPLSLRYPR